MSAWLKASYPRRIWFAFSVAPMTASCDERLSSALRQGAGERITSSAGFERRPHVTGEPFELLQVGGREPQGDVFDAGVRQQTKVTDYLVRRPDQTRPA